MKNKNLLIGGAVVVGGLLFFYFRKKRNSENGETPVDTGAVSTEKGMGMGTSGSGMGTGTTPSSTPSSAPSSTPSSAPSSTSTSAGASIPQLTSFEVNTRLLGRCGIKPPNALKNQRNNWDACKDKFKDELRSQGLISFNGMVEDNRSRLDFDGNIVD
jgi:LPXTG-motif cell wall-anchored protein